MQILKRAHLFILLAALLATASELCAAPRLAVSQPARGGLVVSFLGSGERVTVVLRERDGELVPGAAARVFQGQSRGKQVRGAVRHPAAAALKNGAISIRFPGDRRRSNRAPLYAVVRKADGTFRARRLPAHLRRECAEVGALEELGATEASHGAPAAEAVALGRELELAVLVDQYFVDRHGLEWRDAVNEILNAAEAPYRQQARMRFRVTAVQTPPALEKLISFDAAVLLDQFTEYQNSTQPLGRADAYLLLTGRELEGAVVGIAYLGTTCRFSNDLSFGLSQSFHPALDHLVAAHEIGHLLSAKHDLETPSLMYPSVAAERGSFSVGSLNEIGQHISRHGACLAEVPTGEIGTSPIPPPPPPPPAATSVSVNARYLKRRLLQIDITPTTSNGDELCFVEGYISNRKIDLLRRDKSRFFWFATYTRGEPVSTVERISERLRRGPRLHVQAEMFCDSITVQSQTTVVRLPRHRRD